MYNWKFDFLLFLCVFVIAVSQDDDMEFESPKRLIEKGEQVRDSDVLSWALKALEYNVNRINNLSEIYRQLQLLAKSPFGHVKLENLTIKKNLARIDAITAKENYIPYMNISVGTYIRKPSIVVVGGIYGSDWLAITAVMNVINEFVLNYYKYTNLLERITWIIIPVLNPDGYDVTLSNEKMRNWRKNMATKPELPKHDTRTAADKNNGKNRDNEDSNESVGDYFGDEGDKKGKEEKEVVVKNKTNKEDAEGNENIDGLEIIQDNEQNGWSENDKDNKENYKDNLEKQNDNYNKENDIDGIVINENNKEDAEEKENIDELEKSKENKQKGRDENENENKENNKGAKVKREKHEDNEGKHKADIENGKDEKDKGTEEIDKDNLEKHKDNNEKDEDNKENDKDDIDKDKNNKEKDKDNEENDKDNEENDKDSTVENKNNKEDAEDGLKKSRDNEQNGTSQNNNDGKGAKAKLVKDEDNEGNDKGDKDNKEEDKDNKEKEKYKDNEEKDCFGVDLCLNFEYQWINYDYENMSWCDENYADIPFSQSESRSLRDTLRDNLDTVKLFVAVKQTRRAFTYPYRYTSIKPLFADTFESMVKAAADAAHKQHGRQFAHGHILKFENRTAGDVDDWIKAHFDVTLAFTSFISDRMDNTRKPSRREIRRTNDETLAALQIFGEKGADFDTTKFLPGNLGNNILLISNIFVFCIAIIIFILF